MSGNQDGIVLRHQELVALLALGGKRRFYCYRPEEAAYTEEEIWSICCSLMAEQMITQIDGQFGLRQDLYDVVMPILQADRALTLYIQSKEPSVIFYIAYEGVAVKSTIFGRYSMQAMRDEDIVEELMAHDGIHYYDSIIPAQAANGLEQIPFCTSREQLIEQSDFLITVLKPDDGKIRAWLRGVQIGLEPWLQIADANETKQMVLTRENLCAGIIMLIRGDAL